MSQLIESRAMSTTGVGQQFVPQGFIPQIEIAMLEYGTVSLAADVMRTATGEPMPWPTANDTGNKGRMLSELSGTNNLDTTTSEVLFTSLRRDFRLHRSQLPIAPRFLRFSSVAANHRRDAGRKTRPNQAREVYSKVTDSANRKELLRLLQVAPPQPRPMP